MRHSYRLRISANFHKTRNNIGFTMSVHFLKSGNAGIITLDRPDALHALSIEMVQQMTARLLEWQEDQEVGHIIISATGQRAFCSGGDVRQAVSYVQADPTGFSAEPYFRTEYSLDTVVATYSKPIISLVNGVVMGGGLGLCRNGAIMIVSETIKCAMPETAIGLFPDVGASLFLRAPGIAIGLMLGMTGQIIGAGDAIAWQIADKCVPFDRFDELQDKLCGCDSNISALEELISEFEVSGPDPILAQQETLINSLFQGTVAQIVERVAASADEIEQAQSWHHALTTRCPASIFVIHRLLAKMPPSDSVSEALQLDFQIACRMMRRSDFSEGVRAVLIDKDNAPSWSPNNISSITENEIDAIFEFDSSLRLNKTG